MSLVYKGPKKKRTPSDRFHRCRWQARSRGHLWELTFEQWTSIVKDPCHYCNADTSSITKGSGLDRKDNSVGYIVGNVVSCCYTCNMIKGTMLTYDEALVVLSTLKQYRASKP